MWTAAIPACGCARFFLNKHCFRVRLRQNGVPIASTDMEATDPTMIGE